MDPLSSAAAWPASAPSLTAYLSADHEHCDDLFSVAENAVLSEAWGQAERAWATFAQALLRHFSREENVLFPAFEAQTGMRAGPTAVMREEHAQMTDLLVAMQGAVTQRQSADFMGLAETLLMLMQQHNIKEERILYPLTDQALAAQKDTLCAEMQALE